MNDGLLVGLAVLVLVLLLLWKQGRRPVGHDTFTGWTCATVSPDYRQECCSRKAAQKSADTWCEANFPATPASPAAADIAASVEAGMPTFLDATMQATAAQVKYTAAKAAIKGTPTVDFFQKTAAKARGLCITAVLFAATFLRRAAAKDRARAEAAALQVRAAYDGFVASEAAANRATAADAARGAAVAAERGRVKCQGALLDLILIVEPPGPPPKLPPRLVAVDDCDVFEPAKGFVTLDAERPLSPEQKRVVAYLQDKGRELLAHLLAKYPKDQHTRALNLHWSRRVVPMSERSEIGPTMKMGGVRFSKCVGVSMDVTASIPRSLGTLLHELAHIAGNPNGAEPHTPKFYSVNRKFMRIVTEDLGWTVETWCREACDLAKDTISTSPAAACPKCTWQAPIERCLLGLPTQDTVCRPNPAEEVPSTIPVPTPADVAMLRAQAADAARRADKALASLKTAAVDARTAAQVTAQAMRSISANKRLASFLKATPGLALALNQIAVNGMKAAEAILNQARAPPKPVFTL